VRICDVFRALLGQPEQDSVPRHFSGDCQPSPLLDLPGAITGKPDPPSPYEFSVKWVKDRARMSWADARNYAERSVHGCRWGSWQPFDLDAIVDMIAELKAERAELEGALCEWPSPRENGLRALLGTGGVLPSIQQVEDQIDRLDREGAGSELAAALWQSYPSECVRCGIERASVNAIIAPPFIPTDLQTNILGKLDGGPLSPKELIHQTKSENTFYKPGGIQGLLDASLVIDVKHPGGKKTRLYCRADRLPSESRAD
jgi:hypothetical protein